MIELLVKLRQIRLLMCWVNELKELYKIFVNAKIVKLLEWIEISFFVFFSGSYEAAISRTNSKVGCVFQMVVDSILLHAKIRRIDNRENATPWFISNDIEWPFPLTSLNFSFLWNDSSFIGAIFATFYQFLNNSTFGVQTLDQKHGDSKYGREVFLWSS